MIFYAKFDQVSVITKIVFRLFLTVLQERYMKMVFWELTSKNMFQSSNKYLFHAALLLVGSSVIQ